MTRDLTSNPTPDPTDLRRYVDDELTADEARAFEASMELDSELAARVRGERALRGFVVRAMSVSTPADLAERVRAGLREEPVVAARRRWIDGPTRANALAVAASIALIAGAVLFGILGPPIDDLSAPAGTDLVAETVRGVADEHHDCACRPEARDEKVEWFTPVRAAQVLVSRFGEEIPVVDLEPLGYRFVGLADAGLEGQPESAQLIYTHRGRGSDGCPEGMLSVFIVPTDDGLDALADARAAGRWRTVGNRPECRQRVICSSRGSLVYLLVCCNDEDMESLGAALFADGASRTRSRDGPRRTGP